MGLPSRSKLFFAMMGIIAVSCKSSATEAPLTTEKYKKTRSG